MIPFPSDGTKSDTVSIHPHVEKRISSTQQGAQWRTKSNPRLVLYLSVAILLVLNVSSLNVITKNINSTIVSVNGNNSKLSLKLHDSDQSNDKSSRKQNRVVVSLKTIPSRIQHIEHTLTSLLFHQSMALDKLYLVLPTNKWIPEGDGKESATNQTIHYELPEFLTNLTSYDDRITILRPEYDYGPVDKMLYALQEEEKRPKSMNKNATTTTTTTSNTKLIYVDDDVVYHTDLIKTLVTKSEEEYLDSVVALSGCKLRSHFRQIAHRFPRKNFDKHPNLYFSLSGSESLVRDEVVDVVQGFAGVLIRPSFFDVSEFLNLVRTVTRVPNMWKSDDYIISAYLEHKQIPKRVVVSNALPTIYKPAATTNNVGKGMHRYVMQAVPDLQSRLGVWSEYTFEDYLSLEEHWRDLIDCEAGHSVGCQKVQESATKNVTIAAAVYGNSNSHQPPAYLTRHNATKILDDNLLPPPSQR